MKEPKHVKDRFEQYLDKPLPQAEEAERLVVGSVLLDNIVAHEMFSILEPLDFFSPKIRSIVTAIKYLHSNGKEIDPITIGEELKKEGSLENIGGVAAITNLTYGLPYIKRLTDSFKLIKKKSLARQGIIQANNLITRLLAEDEVVTDVLVDVGTTLSHLQAALISESTDLASVVNTVRETFIEWQSGNTAGSSVSTGIPELDGRLRLGGLAYGELTLIAARPSVGKTALMLQMATNAIRLGVPTLFISLEMLKEKLVMRMLPPLTRIPNKAINPQTLKNLPNEGIKLFDALEAIKDLPMYFDRSFDISQLVSTSEYFIRTKGVKLIVFDYLTMIKDESTNKNTTRDTEVGRITNQLKELSIRTKTAGLGAAQLNRDTEKDFKRPNMKNFRESGVIEQAVDVALFPWDPKGKEHSLNPEAVKDTMWLDLYCAKQRDGEKGWTIPLLYNKDAQTFESGEMRGERYPTVRSIPESPPPPRMEHGENVPDF